MSFARKMRRKKLPKTPRCPYCKGNKLEYHEGKDVWICDKCGYTKGGTRCEELM